MPLKLIKPHQPAGVKWLLAREKSDSVKGGFLCDEMGLGKTAQLIGTMLENKLKRTLVVMPKSILGQWQSELDKFSDGRISVRLFDGPQRTTNVGNIKDFEGVVLSPYSVLTERTILHETHWDRIILDEGHEIRNPKTKIHSSLRSMSADVRWVVTGTPVFNSMKDFVALCNFVGVSTGTVLRSYDEVRQKYVLRRTRPTKPDACIQQTLHLDMYPEEQAVYDRAFDAGREMADHMRKHGTTAGSAMIMLECLLRVRQAMTWPQLYLDGIATKNLEDPERYTGRSMKHETLIRMIADHPDEKTLVFTQFIGETDRIQELLVGKGIPVFRIDGNVSDKTEREARIQGFRDAPDGAVFLIQIRAGGVGLNLQDASRVYITSPAWNPATELQAIGRAHRTGQTRQVHVTRLIYAGKEDGPSIEESILALHEKKSHVVAEVLGEKPKMFAPSNMSVRTIAKIFSSVG